MTLQQRKKNYQLKLPKIVAALKRGYKPEKIILFGSMLSKKQVSNDIDLFLIKKTDTYRLGKRAREARKFVPFSDVPIDFLVYTPEEIKNELARNNVFIGEILQKGKTLFAK